MPATKRVEQKLRDLSRRKILDETASLLVRQGYGTTSLRDIARACKMKAGSLYYHFESKDALVEEVLTEGVTRVETAVRAALEDRPGTVPLDRVLSAMIVHLRVLHDRSDYASAHIRCFQHVPPAVRTRLTQARRSYDEVWTNLLQEVRSAGGIEADVDLHTLKQSIIGILNWTLEWRQPKPADYDELGKRFYRIIFDGAGRAG